MWPLPFPPETFIMRPHELGAWTAALEGVPLGHISLRRVVPGGQSRSWGEDELAHIWAHAHHRPVSELACISAFFVATTAQRKGVGRRLLETAVARGKGGGFALCLDNVVRGRAVAVYEQAGWRVVGQFRPPWLPAGEPSGVAMILPL